MTTRTATQSANADPRYAPCADGIHICGVDPTETFPITVANFPGASRELFDDVAHRYGYKPDKSDAGRDIDLVVDFMAHGDIHTDCCIRRQDLDSVRRMIGAASRPPRLQLSRAAGSRLPADAVKVDRSTMWGNPFRADVVTPEVRASGAVSAADAYRLWLAGNAHLRKVLPPKRADILARLPELRGKPLACWCRPGAPCHADVLLDLANQPETAPCK